MHARLPDMNQMEDYVEIANGDARNLSAGRRSGRVVKKPGFYVPEAPKSQKRKRVQQEGDDDDDDPTGDSSSEGSEDSVSDEDKGEADAEEVKAMKKRRAKSARKTQGSTSTKRAKTATAKTSTLPLRTAARKVPTTVRAPRQNMSAGGDVSQGLYETVFSKGSKAEATANDWILSYQQSGAGAIQKLVNLVLRAAGCTLEVTIEDIEDQDNVTGKLGDLQDEYQGQAVTEYPLISRTKSKPPFRARLTEFFHALITAASASTLLYTDPNFIENIQLWLTTMSSSAIRPFRHTATVILLTMLSALCEVAVNLTEGLATTRRQLEGEQSSRRVNAGRVAILEAKVAEGSKNYEIVEGIIRDIFDTVFVHRYRDVDPKIRVECVEALGHWISTLQDVFFDGSYLRYLGWMLSDIFAQTRLEVVKQLQKLYKKNDNVGGLGTFTERFRSRLVEMATRDADPNVRAATVELLYTIRTAELLEPEDIDAVGKLIFDSEARVRKSVVGFFVENVNDLYESKIEELGGEETLDEILTRDIGDAFDGPRIAWLKLKSLVEILQSYDTEGTNDSEGYLERGPVGASDVLVARGVESRFSLAAQAFFERIPEAREWESLAGYLLFDHSENRSGSPVPQEGSVDRALKTACMLSEQQETILLEVLNAAVRFCLTAPEAVETTKKGKKQKSTKVASEDPETTAMRLAQLIPKLLNKFGAVPAAASAVLRLEHVLDLEVFQQLRQDSTTYAALLDDINKQFVSHSNQAVLAEASAALLHARSFEDLQEVTEVKLQQLWEDLTGLLHSLVENIDIRTRTNTPGRILTELSNNFRRISNLSSISDCVEPLEQVPSSTLSEHDAPDHPKPLLQILLESIDRGVHNSQDDSDADSGSLEDGLVTSAMKTLLFYFMWKLRSLEKDLADGVDVSDASIDMVREYRDAFALKLVRIIQGRGRLDSLRQLATGFLLDLYTLFSTLRQDAKEVSQGKRAPTAPTNRLHSLVASLSTDHQSLVTSVYTAAERAYAKKTGRKVEAAEEDEPIDDGLESESDDDDDDDDEEGAAQDHQKRILVYEQRLCELTGKIVLAIIASVLDAQGPHKGKLKERLSKNKGRLGQNFKEVVAFLDEPKAKTTKKQPAGAKAKKNKPAPKPIVLDEEDADEEQEEIEEGGEEDLRNRELDPDEGHEVPEGEENEEPNDPIEDDVLAES